MRFSGIGVNCPDFVFTYACVISAGDSIKLSTPPKLSAIVNI